MSNFQAKLASVVLIGVAANFGLMAAPGDAARATDNCLTEPKGETPQGKHWFYRSERATGRHCWYLRGEDESPARAPSAEPVAAAGPAPQTAGSAPSRSIADAHAELPPKARTDDGNNAATPPSVWPDPPATFTTGISPGGGVPDNTGADSRATSRLPQTSGAPATPSPAPDASLMVAEAKPVETASATPAPGAPPQANMPIMREVGTLQKLVLVAFGALALAGITGSVVYRLAGALRRRKRRQQRWPQRRRPASTSLAEQARGAPWVAPELTPTTPPANLASDRIESGNREDTFEKIEDFLARLTKQLQNEIQSARSTELENPRPR